MRSPARVGVAGHGAALRPIPVMISTKVSQHINAPRDAVYQALLDSHSVASRMAPDGITCRLHAFDPSEGGALRISLTSNATTMRGRTTPPMDTFHGIFVRLMSDEQVVLLVEFETLDPTMRGEMWITFTLADSDCGGTVLHVVHNNLPPGLSPRHNEAGWRTALAKLAAFVESTMQHA